ncbi:MAG: hypothetical protein PHP45_05530 [Elusimicrobiales bacterium]|nr:hypothetical protein [Elusimicrobiales bacterium]
MSINLAFEFNWTGWSLLCSAAALSNLLRPQFFFMYPVLGIFALYNFRNAPKRAAKAIALIAGCFLAATLLENSINAARFGFFGKHKRMNSHLATVLLFISDGAGDAELFKDKPEYPAVKEIYVYMSDNRLLQDWPLTRKAKSISNYFEDIRSAGNAIMAQRFGYGAARSDAVWRGMTGTLLRKYWGRWCLFSGICVLRQPLVSAVNLAMFLGIFITVFLAFSRQCGEELKTLALSAASAVFFNHVLIAMTTGVFSAHYTVYSDMAVLAACVVAATRLPVFIKYSKGTFAAPDTLV